MVSSSLFFLFFPLARRLLIANRLLRGLLCQLIFSDVREVQYVAWVAGIRLVLSCVTMTRFSRCHLLRQFRDVKV